MPAVRTAAAASESSGPARLPRGKARVASPRPVRDHVRVLVRVHVHVRVPVHHVRVWSLEIPVHPARDSPAPSISESIDDRVRVRVSGKPPASRAQPRAPEPPRTRAGCSSWSSSFEDSIRVPNIRVPRIRVPHIRVRPWRIRAGAMSRCPSPSLFRVTSESRVSSSALPISSGRRR